MRLRFKLVAALLSTGLASVALVGGVAYVSVNYKVDSLRRQQAAEHFHNYMTAYLTEYGDWQSAIATESFDRYVRRVEGAQTRNGAELPSQMLERMPPQINELARPAPPQPVRGRDERRPEPAPDGDFAAPPERPRQGESPAGEGPRDGFRPPPPGDGYGPPPQRWRDGDERLPPPPRAGQAPLATGRQLPDGSYGAPGGARPPAGDGFAPALDAPAGPQGRTGEPVRPPRGEGPPPFHFVLTDADYRVLLGGGQFRPGDALPDKLRATARAIIVKGKPVAYMSSEGALTPTPQEQKYLEALYHSLLWGIGAAAALAIVLGVLLGRGLTRSLSNLTRAVRGMQQGELRQQVPVHGKDEVAALATAFNAMSEQLAHSHEELNASHQTILQQAEQLRELSIRDALTQLYNRRHFDEQANTLFQQAIRHKRPLTLVICDIDHFKKINDNFSHAIGDAVLRHVGAILRNHMRLSDLVARYGGEEFVMAFPETAGPAAAALCDKLRGLIEGFPWHEVHPELKVTMSMGVCADVAAGSAETMLQKADALLYRAKESGRNRVCYAA